MRLLMIILASVGLISLTGFIIIKSQRKPATQTGYLDRIAYNNASFDRLASKTSSIKQFVQKNKLHTSWCFLIDMSIRSGRDRFFVYDLDKSAILLKGLVAHGSGNISSNKIEYSNKPGSNCTSFGKYKIGKSYHGRFGLAYKLHGLDSSNSNAFRRFVVLHAHPCVPDKEIAPAEICKSWGCPTVSPAFLTQLKPYIDGVNKPVLLWILK